MDSFVFSVKDSIYFILTAIKGTKPLVKYVISNSPSQYFVFIFLHLIRYLIYSGFFKMRRVLVFFKRLFEWSNNCLRLIIWDMISYYFSKLLILMFIMSIKFDLLLQKLNCIFELCLSHFWCLQFYFESCYLLLGLAG